MTTPPSYYSSSRLFTGCAAFLAAGILVGVVVQSLSPLAGHITYGLAAAGVLIAAARLMRLNRLETEALRQQEAEGRAKLQDTIRAIRTCDNTDSTWQNAPISATCEVVSSDTDYTVCGEPSAYAYPAMGRGWMSLCRKHALKHHPHCASIPRLISEGETLA